MPHMKFVIIMYYDQHGDLWMAHETQSIHLMVLVRSTSNPYTYTGLTKHKIFFRDARMVGIYLSYSFSNWLQWILISDKLYISIAEQDNKSLRTQKRSPQPIVCNAHCHPAVQKYSDEQSQPALAVAWPPVRFSFCFLFCPITGVGTQLRQ